MFSSQLHQQCAQLMEKPRGVPWQGRTRLSGPPDKWPEPPPANSKGRQTRVTASRREGRQTGRNRNKRNGARRWQYSAPRARGLRLAHNAEKRAGPGAPSEGPKGRCQAGWVEGGTGARPHAPPPHGNCSPGRSQRALGTTFPGEKAATAGHEVQRQRTACCGRATEAGREGVVFVVSFFPVLGEDWLVLSSPRYCVPVSQHYFFS